MKSGFVKWTFPREIWNVLNLLDDGRFVFSDTLEQPRTFQFGTRKKFDTTLTHGTAVPFLVMYNFEKFKLSCVVQGF